MYIRSGDTQIGNDEVGRCESLDELKSILDQKSDCYQDWKYFINRLVEKNHLNYTQMGKICHCSKNTVKKWCNEGTLPQNRDVFIKIALGMYMSLPNTNDLLQRYGKYSALNPKVLGDAVAIFALNHPQKNTEYDPVDYYHYLLERCKRKLDASAAGETTQDIDTQVFAEEMLEGETEQEFEQFILKYSGVYKTAYKKLLQYLEAFIKAHSNNIHEFIQQHGLNASFEKMLSNLKHKGEVPKRMKLIVLGLHLNMSLQQLNDMLALAYMEPICSKDKVECAVLYAVENAYLNNPDFAFENAIALKNYVNNPELQKQCEDITNEYWSERSCTENEDSEEYQALSESISNYLKWILNEIDLHDSEICGLL